MGREASRRGTALGRLLRKSTKRWFYGTRSYLDAYSAHTDSRVERDPHQAVGGLWEEMGTLQFDFLVRNGLEPRHRLLDIGCGTLRGGRHFIRYLDAGGYTGLDISVKAIEYAEQLVAGEGLSEKKPRLLVNRRKDLRFEEFEAEAFDYVLAQSVFTHLGSEHIEECFRHVGRVMRPSAGFFFTFYEAPRIRRSGRKKFEYPFSFFEGLAAKSGFDLTDRSSDYPHPGGQHMAMLTR